MSTIAFTCGGDRVSEFGTTAHWFSATGSVSADTTHVRSGTSAIKISSNGELRKVANTSRYFTMRLSVWIPSVPSVLTRLVAIEDPTSRILEVNTSGYLQWYGGTASLLPVPLAQWVTVDLFIDASANPHVSNWRVNGVAQTQVSVATAANNIVQFWPGGGNASAGDRWIDDLVTSYTNGDYPIPNGSSVWNGSAEVWSETHTGSFALTGGGVVAETGSKSASTGYTLTGGGVVAAGTLAGRLGAFGLTGGGVVASAAFKDAVGAFALTGGGVVTVGASAVDPLPAGFTVDVGLVPIPTAAVALDPIPTAEVSIL